MKLLYLDTETTGTDPNRHGIVQIAGIIEVDGDVKEEFNFKVDIFLEDEVDEDALKITGLTMDDILSYPSPGDIRSELVQKFSKYVDRYNKKDKFWFVGYNARFDFEFMYRFFEKCGDSYFGSWVWFPPICVAQECAMLTLDRRAEFPNFKLETVAEKFGLLACGTAAFHDAMFDVRTTRELWLRVRNGQSQC